MAYFQSNVTYFAKKLDSKQDKLTKKVHYFDNLSEVTINSANRKKSLRIGSTRRKLPWVNPWTLSFAEN